MNPFSRTQFLLGSEAMEKLKNARIAVFGVGGVGGYTVEALAELWECSPQEAAKQTFENADRLFLSNFG